MRFPGPEFCLENNLFMIVGSIPAKTKKNLEVYFATNGTDEAFHMREGLHFTNLSKTLSSHTFSLELEEEYIRRWGVLDNVTEDLQGQPGDGTTIDREEPFIIRIKCDGDGWILQVNKEPAYDTFLHRVPIPHILNVNIKGTAHISYVGFGTDGKPFKL